MDFTVQGVNDSDKRKYDYADESLGWQDLTRQVRPAILVLWSSDNQVALTYIADESAVTACGEFLTSAKESGTLDSEVSNLCEAGTTIKKEE